MKSIISACLLILTTLTGCKQDSYSLASTPFIVTEIQEKKYSVIYLQNEGESTSTARNRAMERSAELTRQKGYRYFYVESEQSVIVTRSMDRGGQSPSNLYYNDIQEHDFSKENLERRSSTSRNYNGYKVVIRLYQENPPRGAIEA